MGIRRAPQPISDVAIPAAIARDTEIDAAINTHVANSEPHSQYFRKNPIPNSQTTNPDTHATGLTANDSNIDGIIKGWHFLTNMRGGSDFGIQLAFCDTQNNVKYRRKTGGVWQPWVTIV